MIDTDKYEGHLTGGDGEQTWCWSKWMLKNAETMVQMNATAALLNDAPLLLAEVKRLHEIEQEWLMMWATLEELNLVADVRKNMIDHGWEGDD